MVNVALNRSKGAFIQFRAVFTDVYVTNVSVGSITEKSSEATRDVKCAAVHLSAPRGLENAFCDAEPMIVLNAMNMKSI